MWHTGCNLIYARGTMSTGTFYSPSVNNLPKWANCFPAVDLSYLTVSRSVRADRGRIFQAITVPEYMETWLSAPGSIPGYTRVLFDHASFSISGPTDDGSSFRIGCTLRQCRRSKLVFSWQRDSLAETAPSTVRIRLQGDFDRTTVDVTHTGLSERERRWCGAFWEASIEKLSRLF